MKKMRNLWMLAALLFCFAAVGCSDDDEKKEDAPAFGKVTCDVSITVSESLREVVTLGGELIGFNGEELLTDIDFMALSYSTKLSTQLLSEEDLFPKRAGLKVTATKVADFVESSAKKDLQFEAEMVVKLFDTEGNLLASKTERVASNLTGAEFTKEMQSAYVSLFPKNLQLKISKNGGEYQIEITK